MALQGLYFEITHFTKKVNIVIKKITFLSVLFLTGFVLGVTQSSAQHQPKPVIISLQGHVSVNVAGEKWQPAEKGMVLQEDSVIKTADQSQCDVAFDLEAEHVVSLGSNTELKMGELFKRVHLVKGRVFTRLKQLGRESDFEVHTPVAIAGARGTAWETSYDLLTVDFNVGDSTIYVKGIGEDGEVTAQIDVSNGFAVAVDGSGILGELTELSDEDKERIGEWMGRISENIKIQKSNGSLGDLFSELLEGEIADSEAAFAAGEEGPSGPNDGGNNNPPSLTGGDISLSTFTPQQNVTPPPIIEEDNTPPLKEQIDPSVGQIPEDD